MGGLEGSWAVQCGPGRNSLQAMPRVKIVGAIAKPPVGGETWLRPRR